MEISEQDYKGLTDELKKVYEENKELNRRVKQYENIIFAIESVCKISQY